MITKVFKNNNISIRFEPDYDYKPANLNDFVCDIVNNDELNGFDVNGYEAWGNDYGAYLITLYTNGKRCYYYVTNDDYEKFVSGRAVRLVFDSYAPLFTLPRFYDFKDVVRKDGVKGCIYTLCNPLDDETREEMRAAGCDILISQCEYAPEIKHPAVFVPNGVRFSYC